MSLDAIAQYLTEFFHSHQAKYQEMMLETGSARHPPTFEGEAEVIQAIRNVVHNISDNFWDLSIPKGFVTPERRHKSLVWLRDMADRQVKEVEEVRAKNGGNWFEAMAHAHEINSEVRDAINHALSLSAATSVLAPAERLRHMLGRLPAVARQLLHRRNEGGVPRSTLKINDEYDVQDLLHAILKLEFDDVRPEEWTPSYAGRSTRMDFLLKKESVVIEVKKTRVGLGGKEVGQELIIDIAHYKTHKDCAHLVCFVWDDEHRISNPQGLKSDLEKSNAGFVSIEIVH